MITSFFAQKKRKSPSNNTTTEHSSDYTAATEINKSTTTVSEDDKRDSSSCNNTTIEKRSKTAYLLTVPLSLVDRQHSSSRTEHVCELVSTLTEESWKNALQKYFEKPSFASLASFVARERKNHQVYPPPQDTFTALNLVPLDKVKVVVVGQDPYHGSGQGHGLAFSVRKGVPIPPSLKNIYKELLDNRDCGLNLIPKHGCLERWARQGVLLLNTVLTVRRGEANSHKNRGWEDFTDEVIRCLFTKTKKHNNSHNNNTESERCNSAGGIVFLLWGAPASKKAESILKKYSGVGHVKTVVLCSSHPSPLGAHKTDSPFMGSQCFANANEALRSMGLAEIDWGVDGPLSLSHIEQVNTVVNDDIQDSLAVAKAKEQEVEEEIVVTV
mmetsp:Transcript_12283/g.23010  ORF Transcript_12283/g.23010 Transcript_12283/m.23010 type:complete len:384 (-) Transcript_12283:3389-4540(-)